MTKHHFKKGTLYSDIRHDLKPFDILLFKGKDFISNTIRQLQKYDISHDIADNFSHIGMVVTSDILDYEFVKPGKIYIIESSISGRFGQGVKTVEGKSKFGVILRDFDELVHKYDKSIKTKIAVGHVKKEKNPFLKATNKKKQKALKAKFTKYFHTVNHVSYDLNPISLLSTFNTPLTYPFRLIRKFISDFTDTNGWTICSALIASVYIHMGIWPENIEPKNTLPVDFLGIDDDGAPLVITLPPRYIITPKHYLKGLSELPASEDAEYKV